MNRLLAQSSIPLPGNLRGLGPFGLEGEVATTAPTKFNSFLSATIGILTIVAGIFFIFVLITGAISWIGAGGDQGKIAEARQRITMGLVGITAVIAAIFIVEIVGGLLGFPSILNPGSLINQLGPTP